MIGRKGRLRGESSPNHEGGVVFTPQALEYLMSMVPKASSDGDLADVVENSSTSVGSESAPTSEPTTVDSVRADSGEEATDTRDSAMTVEDVERLNERIYVDEAHDVADGAAGEAGLLGVSPKAVRSSILGSLGVAEAAHYGSGTTAYSGAKDQGAEVAASIESTPRERFVEMLGRKATVVKWGGVGLAAAAASYLVLSGYNEFKGSEREDLSATLKPTIDSSEDRLSLDMSSEIGWPYETEGGDTNILRLNIAGEAPRLSIDGGVSMIVNELEDGAVSVVEKRLPSAAMVAEVDLGRLEVELKAYPDTGEGVDEDTNIVEFDKVDFSSIETEGFSDETAAMLAEKQDNPQVIEDAQRELLLFAGRELHKNATHKPVVMESLRQAIADSLKLQAEEQGWQLDKVEFKGDAEPVFVDVDFDPSLLNEMSQEEAVVETIQGRSPDVELIPDSIDISNLEVVDTSSAEENNKQTNEAGE